MNIFEIKNYQVVFSPQALLLTPFKKIWDKDKDKEKVNAVAEMSYVYYICDDRSDFQYILDETERHEAICRDMDALPNDWECPDYIEDAIEYYKKLSETTSTKLLRSTRGVVQKISTFLDVVDVNERDLKTNKPIFDIGKVVSAVEKIPKLVKALNQIEEEVIKEKELKTQSGNRQTGVFDDMGI